MDNSFEIIEMGSVLEKTEGGPGPNLTDNASSPNFSYFN
jgi:hypothetical protein